MKTLAKLVLLASAAAVTATGYGCNPQDTYKQKVERIMEQTRYENPIKMGYNKNDMAMSYQYEGDFYHSILDMESPKGKERWIVFYDYAHNGFGDVDLVSVWDSGKSYQIRDIPKDLLKESRAFFRRGVDATIDKIDNGNTSFEGPSYEGIMKRVKDEWMRRDQEKTGETINGFKEKMGDKQIRFDYNGNEIAATRFGYTDAFMVLHADGPQQKYVIGIADVEDNGYGNVDGLIAIEGADKYVLDNPSEELQNFAYDYFRNGVDATLKNLQYGLKGYSGPASADLLAKIKEAAK